MNYTELQQAVLDDTHRPDLSTHIVRFIRQAEGMIRRDLTGYLLTDTLEDSDRVSGGVYNLPVRIQEIRSIQLQGRQGDTLAQVSPGQIRRLESSCDVVQFAVYGNGTIEFRGHPSASDVFDLLYFGTPAALSTEKPYDEHELLEDHESLYMSASKFYLYMHTQDRELANDELGIYNNLITKLNELVSRKIGGASIAPTYNMAGGSSY